MNIPGIELPKELLEALDVAKALPGSTVEELLKIAIDKLALKYGDDGIARSDRAFVKSAVFTVVYLGRRDDGEMEEKTRQIIFDPSNFSIQEHQRYRKHVESDGRVVEMEKLGRPYAVVVGSVMNQVVQVDKSED